MGELVKPEQPQTALQTPRKYCPFYGFNGMFNMLVDTVAINVH